MDNERVIVFTSVPKVAPWAPLSGPAVLKGYLSAHGIDSFYLDWNRELYDRYHEKVFWEFGSDVGRDLQDEYFHKVWDETRDWTVNRFREEIRPTTKFIGLSILSFESYYAARHLIRMIREEFPDIQIVLGGTGSSGLYEELKDAGLIDHIIAGDGEEALVALVQGEEHEGHKKYLVSQTLGMDDVPFADYDDLDMTKYDRLFLRSSKGCVKNCSFCDVRSLWPKFQFQSIQRTVDELEDIYKRYPDIKDVEFSDSLLNGSPTNFRKMLEMIIDRGIKLKLRAKIIIRTPKQMPASDYDLMKEAGFTTLIPGVESGSFEVRKHMGKDFTDDDLEFFLEHMGRVRLRGLFLFIVGYITETEEDFQKTLDLISHIHANHPTVVDTVAFGEQLFILEHTPLSDMKEQFDVFDHTHWEMNGITREIRVDRQERLIAHAKEMSINPVCRKGPEGDVTIKRKEKVA